MDVRHDRCAGLDVHKKTVVACVRRVDPAGKVSKLVKTFATNTADLLDLSDWLAAGGAGRTRPVFRFDITALVEYDQCHPPGSGRNKN